MLAKGIEVELEDSVSDSGAEVRLARRKEQRRAGKSSKSSSGIVVDNKLDSSAAIVADKREHQDSSRVYLQRIARGTSKLANELASTTTTKANKQTARGCPIEIDKWSDFGPLKNEALQLQHCNNIDSDIVADNDDVHDNSARSRVVVGQALGHSLVIEEEAGQEGSISLIGYQLLTLILGLLLLLYLFDIVQRLMTNLLSKILGGGERRRSLANNAQQQRGRQQGQQQEDQQLLQAGIAQSHSSSTLSLPRNSSPIIGASSNQRRSSRSSIHSVSALFISAFTGGGNSSTANSGQSSMNNGNALFSPLAISNSANRVGRDR